MKDRPEDSNYFLPIPVLITTVFGFIGIWIHQHFGLSGERADILIAISTTFAVIGSLISVIMCGDWMENGLGPPPQP